MDAHKLYQMESKRNFKVLFCFSCLVAALCVLATASIFADSAYAGDVSPTMVSTSFDEVSGTLAVTPDSSGTDIKVALSGFSRKGDVTKIVLTESIVAPPNMMDSFAYFGSLVSIDGLGNLDTSNVTHMGSMFDGCSSLVSLDLSTFNTSKVTSLNGTFANCRSLVSLDLSSFDTSSAVTMGYMFTEAESIMSLKLGEKFSFNGARDERMDVSLYPPYIEGFKGTWTDGTAEYTSDEIPNNVAATYTPAYTDYTINYHLDGGINAATNPVTYTIITPTITLANATKEGYVFEGWYESSDFSGTPVTTIESGSKGNVELYAKWRAVAVTRLAGSTALETMETIVQEGDFTSGQTVVLATSSGYWDALTASGISGLTNAPVVLTDSTVLATETKNVLDSLNPSRIIVCGGPAAISEGVLAEISERYKVNPERLYGDDAILTSIDAYKKLDGWSSTAVISNIGGYWDALSAAPLAYTQSYPIFLSLPDTGLTQETLNAMKEGGITEVLIAGGEVVVPALVEEQLSDIGITVIERFAGADASVTSNLIADYAVRNLGMSVNNSGVATMGGYWDALCGAALCGKNNSVLLLADDGYYVGIDGVIKDNAASIENIYIFGGIAAVSQQTEDYLKMSLGVS